MNAPPPASQTEQPDVMPFGQYAGLDYDALVIEDPRYAAWIVQQPWLDPTIATKPRTAIANYRAYDDAYDDC